jgi:hypothetical protein
MDISLQEEINQVRVVDIKRNYWFIRTYGGSLYNYFLDHNFIGLGFNSVPYKYIKEAKQTDEAAFNRLQIFIDNNTEYKKGEATKWANQLIYFEHELQIDDIVIIPSEHSDYLSVGIVESETYIAKVNETFKFDDKFESYPEKRRRVKWLKTIPKLEFRGALNSMFFSRTAIKNVNDFSEAIEGNLSSLYIKDDHIYLSIKIDQDEEINAFEFQRFLESLTYLYKELCIDNGIKENEELYIKIKVQSKGGVFLKGLGVVALFSLAGILSLSSNSQVIENLEKVGKPMGLLTLAAIVALSDNNKIKIELGKWGKIEGHSDGFLKSLGNFLDGSQKRKIELTKFTDSVEKLKANQVIDSVTKEEDQAPNGKKKSKKKSK